MPSSSLAAKDADGPTRLPAQARMAAEIAAMIAASTLGGLLAAPRWGTAPVDLLYLPPVLAAATLYGFRPALAAATASALAYNFFFTAPLHSFRVDRPADLVTVLVLFLVAAVTSRLAGRMREQARIAAANATRNATIAGLARRLLSCSSEGDIAKVACEELASLFACNAVLVVADAGLPRRVAGSGGAGPLTPSDIGAAALTLASGEPSGRGSPRLDPAEWLFHPVRSETGVLAAMGLARDDGRQVVAEAGLPLLGNLLDQVALALDRSALEAELRGMEALRERDRLRGALLSSVGHDLRTPLTMIVAAAAELPDRAEEGELAATIRGEASKIQRYIANLLDMARIEAGAIRLKAEPTDLVDSVAAALGDLGRSLEGRPVAVDLPPGLPLLRTDPSLLHHVLINLIDNAARHSGAGSAIEICGRLDEDGGATLTVADEGPGLNGAGRGIFETFAGLSGSDRKGGAGLGLAIVKGLAEAMGVGVDAADRTGRAGAIFALRFAPAAAMHEAEIGQGAEDTRR